MREYDPASTRTWRMLSMVLPSWYREQYGRELVALHVERSGRNRGLRFWSAVVVDVAVTAVQLRGDAVRESRMQPVPRERAGSGASRAFLLAVRGLRRTPGFTVAVVLMLALGIGANAAMFTVLDRVLLQAPPHIAHADQVKRVFVYDRPIWSPTPDYMAALTYPDYRALKDVSGFASVAAYSPSKLTLGVDASSERIATELATASYFPLLGVSPALGRFYDESEDQIGAGNPVAVISYGMWQRRFGGASTALGQALDIGAGRYTVVGVAPKGFTGVDIAPVDVWLPLHTAAGMEQGTQWTNATSWYWLSAVVRIGDKVSVAAIEQDAAARRSAIRPSKKRTAVQARVVLAPVLAALGPKPGSETMVAKLLGGVAVIVLLIACSNVANLFFARGVRRRRQFAVQSALGGSRAGLIAQVLCEAAIVAAVAGIAAFFVATALAPALFHFLLPAGDLPNAGGLRVLGMTAALSLVTCVIAGLAPAIRSGAVDVAEVLRSGRGSTRSSWTTRGLLGAQAALSVLLLIGAGLFIKSLRTAQHRDFGVNLEAAVLRFEAGSDSASRAALTGMIYAALERLQREPMVVSAALTANPPFNGFWGLTVDTPRPDSVPSGIHGPLFVSATSGYFRTMGMSLRRGRELSDGDDRTGAAPVAVVNEAMARSIWNERNPVGQCLLIGDPKKKPACTTVVGVVSDIVAGVSATAPQSAYYIPPHHPAAEGIGAQSILVRVKGNARAALPELRAAARSAAPGIRYVATSLVGDPLEQQLRSWKLGATLFSAFGILALIVAAGGLYSVLAFDVAQRRFELGIRSALGARAARLVWAILGRTISVTAVGAAIGVGAALLLARRSADLLYRTQPTDPMVYVQVAVLMLGVAAVAGIGPAIRATRVDPNIAMRDDWTG